MKSTKGAVERYLKYKKELGTTNPFADKKRKKEKGIKINIS